MSYILDALNRADAERERGSVPGLHARQTYAQTSKAANSHSRLWIALAAALTMAGIAAGVWLWRSPADTATPAVAATAPGIVPVPVPAPAADPAPVPSAPVAAAPVEIPVAKPAKRPVAPTKTPKVAQKPVVDKSPVQPQAAPKPTPIEKEIVAASAAVSIPLLSELSSTVRGQVPPLTITGAVYSKNPGQRLLLVNNQVLNQGHLAAPEVTLEEIRANSSVFSFRGTKFRLQH